MDKHLLVDKSPTLRRLVNTIKEIADDDLPMLLQGETGTGKSYLARAIHSARLNTNGLFVSLDCATFNANLIESELFGHEKGAFTGATEVKSGMFELACGGTVLLDEVENLTRDIQAKLLRVLDEKKFRRVGGRRELEAYFQLVSTVNVDVDDLLVSGALRKDFYYRIASISLTLPPLRDRPEDILVFAERFLHLLGVKHGREITLSKESKNLLMQYHWPGNIRELKHTLMAAVKRAKKSKLSVEDFDGIFTSISSKSSSLKSLAEIEKEHIQLVLKRTGYKIAQSTRILGIAENTLRSKMRKYGLQKLPT
ncbi:sigma 54-interacting transcriptional regulator [bacterium]|nr:sigma 54-interacting transcriptional regulator [bacterium]